MSGGKDGAGPLFRELLRVPATLAGLERPQQELALRLLRQAHLLGWCAARLSPAQWDSLPQRVRDQLDGALTLAHHQARLMGWDLNRLERLVAGHGVTVLLLKGAAYQSLGLAVARGRLASDVDLLVPPEQLAPMEALLAQGGWRGVKLDPYDQRYYREWMHELPPLRHGERWTWLDLHHAILPRTSRLHPSTPKLLAAARPLAGSPFLVPSPEDLVLHGATHLFYDNDLAEPWRGLVDLDGLLGHYGGTAGFWEGLLARAGELELRLPLHYALRHLSGWMGTPVPEGVLGEVAGWGGRWSPVVDRLVARALWPDHPDRVSRGRERALWLLYVRSHWLRMPPGRLAAHLLRKGVGRVARRRTRWPA